MEVANSESPLWRRNHDDQASRASSGKHPGRFRPHHFELNDLIDDEIILGRWTDPDCSGGEPISRDHEVGATTPTVGNYGSTLDRWYRRAAVVAWPRDRAFAARAEAGSQWALHQLRDRIDAGDLEDGCA